MLIAICFDFLWYFLWYFLYFFGTAGTRDHFCTVEWQKKKVETPGKVWRCREPQQLAHLFYDAPTRVSETARHIHQHMLCASFVSIKQHKSLPPAFKTTLPEATCLLSTWRPLEEPRTESRALRPLVPRAKRRANIHTTPCTSRPRARTTQAPPQ